MSKVWADAEAFSFPAEPGVGVLLIHGFTGSPAEMRPLGTMLGISGYEALCVRLRGHGTHPRDLLDVVYTDWIADAEAGLHALLAVHQQVFIVGLSMGGALALNLAARYAEEPRLAGVVTLCAPMKLFDWRLRFVPFIGRLQRWQGWGRPDIRDSAAWARHRGYRRFRPTSILHLVDLLRETTERLPDVRVPLLVVQARKDHMVSPINGQIIYDLVASADRQLVWLDESFHIVTLDVEAERVHAEVAHFIAARVQAVPESTVLPSP